VWQYVPTVVAFLPVKRQLVLGAVLLASCASAHPASTSSGPRQIASSTDSVQTTAQPSLVVTLRHGTPAERDTKIQLGRLLTRYDLSRWFFTRTVVIDEDAVPHSHPVLTLHTRHLRDDLLLLSTFVHEQSHWYVQQHRPQVDAAVADFRAIWPT